MAKRAPKPVLPRPAPVVPPAPKSDGRVAALEKQVAGLVALVAANGMSLPTSLAPPKAKAKEEAEEAPEVAE